MTSQATSVEQYLSELPIEKREALSKLRSLIQKVAPEATEQMKYGMPVFGDLCAFASQKHYLALYVCDLKVVEAHRAQLGKLNCGKGCIRFKCFDDLPIQVIEAILKQ